jgi:signal transduction histidine kinase
VENARTSLNRSSELGLSIYKWIVAAYVREIRINSELSKRTIVTISLPRPFPLK